jgi:hypothetical protein
MSRFRQLQLLPVGRLRTNFYLPELNIDATEDSPQKSSPPVQKVVSRINKFIENIGMTIFCWAAFNFPAFPAQESKLTTARNTIVVCGKY